MWPLFPLPDVHHGAPVRVVLGLAQDFARGRGDIAFAEEDEAGEVLERVPSAHPKYTWGGLRMRSRIASSTAAMVLGTAVPSARKTRNPPISSPLRGRGPRIPTRRAPSPRGK